MDSTVTVSPAQLLALAPHCLPAYRQGFLSSELNLGPYGINLSGLRLAHFMAQVLHESGALTIQYENLRYSAARLPQVWPSRFKPRGPLDPAEYAYNEEKLANEVYGGRMGNTSQGDGYRYRGRGLLQLTGKASYVHASEIMRTRQPEAPDFGAEPDAVLAALWCVGVAACEWHARGCNEAADGDDLVLVTQRINGGTIGLQQRRVWLERTRPMWSAVKQAKK